MRRFRWMPGLLLAAIVASACGGGDSPSLDAVPPAAAEAGAGNDQSARPSLSDRWPEIASEPRVVTSPTGVVLPVVRRLGEGWRVITPCGNEADLAKGRALGGAHVVIDPGHGGTESGAVTKGGVTESEVNFQVARELKRVLEAEGLTVQLTREADYRVPIQTRTDIVNALSPLVFLSIHHNGGEAASRETPGTEVYFQQADAHSRRLAGLVWEDIVASLSVHDIAWTGGSDAGAIYRPGRDGGDFYGILRGTAGIPAVLVEAGYLSNPPEAELFERPDIQTAEAVAIARAVLRYLTTDDSGSGFRDPVFRGYGSSGGGGTFVNCRDPDLS